MVAAAGAACSAPLAAAQVIPIGEVQQVSDAELARQRGGFSWNGLDIQFGAEVRSYLNGALVLQTDVSWADAPVSSQGAVSAAPAGAALQTIKLTAAGLPIALDLNLDKAKVLLANQGRTAFIQRTDGAVQSILLNTASNVALRQQVDIRLDVAGFAPFLSSILAARVGASLSTVGALGIMR